MLSKTENQLKSTCENPAHQVNVFRKGVCVRRITANFVRHPVFQPSVYHPHVQVFETLA